MVDANIVPVITTSTTIDSTYSFRIIPVKSSGAITLTFGALPDGFNCAVVQLGSGQVTLSGTQSQQSFTKTAGQYAICGVLTVGGVNILSGDGA